MPDLFVWCANRHLRPYLPSPLAHGTRIGLLIEAAISTWPVRAEVLAYAHGHYMSITCNFMYIFSLS